MMMYKKLAAIFLLFFSALASAQQSPVKHLEQYVADNKGKVILIDFWASWCIPCKDSFPWLNEMQEQHKDLRIISVNLDHQKSYATEFLAEIPANFPVIYDPKGIVSRQFRLKGMPSSYLINKEGEMVSAHVGFNEEKRIAYVKEIEQLLAE